MNRFEERFPRLWAFLEQVSLMLFAGLLFWLFAGLIVTLPAALTALFAAVAPLVRPGVSGEVFGRFWRAFRRSFWGALGLGLLDLALGLLLWADMRLFWSHGTAAGKAVALGFGSLAAVILLVNLFAWPLLAWYPQPLGDLLRRAFLLAGAHPLLALGGLAGAAFCILALLLLPWPLTGLLPALGPGLAAAVIGIAAWKGMERHARPEDPFAE